MGTIHWHAFGGLERGRVLPVSAWSDVDHVFITNRLPLERQASGFVGRYRSVVEELVTRGPTALVVVLEPSRNEDEASLARELAASYPGVRYVVIAVIERRAGSATGGVAALLRSLTDRSLGALPPLGPGPDVVFVVADALLCRLVLAPRTSRGVFLLEEGFGRNDPPPSAPLAALLRRWQRMRLHSVYRRVQRDGRPVVVLTPTERGYLSRWIREDRMHVVPLCLNDRSASPDPVDVDSGSTLSADDRPFTVGCVARLEDPRTAEPLADLVDATVGVRPWRWMLVGVNPPERLSDLARLHPDSVVLTGRVGSVDPYYGQFDVVVVPASSSTGSKTTLLQAWSHGVPCVASDASADSVDAVDGVDCVVVRTIAEAVAQLDRLAGDPELRDRLVAGGRRRTDQLDGRAAARTIVDLAVGGRSASAARTA